MGVVLLGEEEDADLRESWRGAALAWSARNLLTSPGDERFRRKTYQRCTRVTPSEAAAAQIPLIRLARFAFCPLLCFGKVTATICGLTKLMQQVVYLKAKL